MTGLKIKSVKARAVNVPLSAPHPTAGGTVTSAPLVLIDLETDGGVIGRTYLFCYTAFALKPVAALVQSFGELIAGAGKVWLIWPVIFHFICAWGYLYAGPVTLAAISRSAASTIAP